MIAFWVYFVREVMRFRKVVVQTVVTPLVSSFLYLLVFGVSLGSTVNPQNGQIYLAFLIPGLMMMGLMNNAFQNASSSIITSKFSGEMEDLRVVPLGPHQIIWAMSLAAVVRGGLVALITFVVGALFYFQQQSVFLSVAHPLELLFFVLVGGLVFGKIGLSAAFWAKNFDQLSAIGAFIILPLTYLGGVFISIESLSPFWQELSKLNPLLYFINGIRHAVLGVSDVPIYISMIVSGVALVVFHLLAQYSVRRGSFHRW